MSQHAAFTMWAWCSMLRMMSARSLTPHMVGMRPTALYGSIIGRVSHSAGGLGISLAVAPARRYDRGAASTLASWSMAHRARLVWAVSRARAATLRATTTGTPQLNSPVPANTTTVSRAM